MNEDQNQLGTAPIGKLLFQMALPSVVAQLINMLYNIVDRIYIGHIPEVGALALTGVGVCMPHHHDRFRLCRLCGLRAVRRVLPSLWARQDHESAEKIAGQLLYRAAHHFRRAHRCAAHLEPADCSWPLAPA